MSAATPQLVVVAIVLCLALLPVASAGLVSPWSWQAFPQTSGLECKAVAGPNEFPADLPMSIFDSSDADQRATDAELTEDIDLELSYLSRTSDFAVDAQDSHRADCMLEFVAAWSATDAFVCKEGVVESDGTRYYRTRFTTSVASSFLKGGNGLDWTGSQMTNGKAWFQKMHDCNKAWLLTPLQQMGSATSNNSATDDPHHTAYPALLSVLLTSVVLQDESEFLWAANELNVALDTITEEGTTINELDEAGDALFHHSSGVLMYGVPAALVVHANKQTPWNTTAGASFRDTARHPGLARLAYRTADGLFNSDHFTQTTGKTQSEVDCTEESWAWLYWNLMQEDEVRVRAEAAVVNMTTSSIGNVDAFRELVDRCSPEHTFAPQLGGRTCWWYPSTFYDSPCTGWTEGPLFALGVTALAVTALICMCVCFLCHRDTCMSWATIRQKSRRHLQQSTTVTPAEMASGSHATPAALL